MANEFQTDYTTGKVVYFLLRNSVAQVWHVGNANFENYVTANYGNYHISGAEQGTASAYYAASMPAPTAGVYYVVAKERIGGSPAETDPSVGWGDLYWTGAVVTLPYTSGQAINILSGNLVNVFSGQLSGYSVSPISGASVIASLYSGQSVLVYSGQLSGQQVTAASGVFSTASLNSGQPVLVYSGQLSGQQVTARTVTDKSGYTAGLISGVDFIASGHSTVSTLYSGQSVLVYSGQLSGQPITTTVASGLFVNASLNSGQFVLVYSGQLSGQIVTPASGTTYLGSGQITREIPKSIMTWDFSGAPDTSGIRCSLEAQRKLINRWSLSVASGYLRVYKEDDSTKSYDQAVTSTSGANPITSVDT